MTDKSESKYAAQLRELGFKEYEPDESRDQIYAVARVMDDETEISPPQTPMYRPHEEGPHFISMGGVLEMTIAVDEIGQKWIARKVIDLTPLGFADIFREHPLQ